MTDALDRVFIHGVMVVHIELHHRHDGCEFGYKRPQNTQFIHAPQSPFRVAVLDHRLKEQPVGYFAVTHLFVDQMQVCR